MRFLLDVNVPDRLPTFQDERFCLVRTLDPKWSDLEIWNYALENNLVIVTKDTDFFHRSMVTNQPPKIVHLKIGNMRLQEFSAWIDKNWSQIETLLTQHQLVMAYQDRIEAIL